MSDKLTYEPYNKKSFAVRGDREKYGNVIRKLGGRWNIRLKNGPGWTVPTEKENELKKLINDFTSNTTENLGDTDDPKDKEIERIKNNAKSRKDQYKYHRAVSEDSENDDSPLELSEKQNNQIEISNEKVSVDS